MRVWDVHPGYLSNSSLLGQHVEIHALYSVILGGKRGYAAHPETLRWREHLAELVARHDLTVREMTLRSFNHASPMAAPDDADGSDPLTFVDPAPRQFGILREKYEIKQQSGRIPLPISGSQFWAHHKYAVMLRGYRHYKEMQAMRRDAPDRPIGEETEFIDAVLALLLQSPDPKAIHNVLNHLWGYFKDEASPEERLAFQTRVFGDVRTSGAFLFELAGKYQQMYLLHSTVFTDL